MPICLRLFCDCMRAAASLTFWTAGSKRPMRMAMIAMTTRSSISVKPVRFIRGRDIRGSLQREKKMMALFGGAFRDVDQFNLAPEEGDVAFAVLTVLLEGEDRRARACAAALVEAVNHLVGLAVAGRDEEGVQVRAVHTHGPGLLRREATQVVPELLFAGGALALVRRDKRLIGQGEGLDMGLACRRRGLFRPTTDEDEGCGT